jgi:hypothetical protein
MPRKRITAAVKKRSGRHTDHARFAAWSAVAIAAFACGSLISAVQAGQAPVQTDVVRTGPPLVTRGDLTPTCPTFGTAPVSEERADPVHAPGCDSSTGQGCTRCDLSGRTGCQDRVIWQTRGQKDPIYPVTRAHDGWYCAAFPM